MEDRSFDIVKNIKVFNKNKFKELYCKDICINMKHLCSTVEGCPVIYKEKLVGILKNPMYNSDYIFADMILCTKPYIIKNKELTFSVKISYEQNKISYSELNIEDEITSQI